jgi:peptidoglycan/LPS O-acetylase OafA/YrhL
MRIIFAVVFLGFLAFSSWVTLETSYLGAFPPFDDLNTLQIFCDLAISATLVIFLVFRERRAGGRPLWPVGVLAIGVALLGSIALLAYFVIEPPGQLMNEAES